MNRKYNAADHFLIQIDKGLRTLTSTYQTTQRKNPAHNIKEEEMSQSELQLSARLMRVNHSGEVSAQALYQGQALTAKLEQVRSTMDQAALEENDHLAWCESRVHELNEKTSLLNPIWYAGSFTIGAVAGLMGDKWSLGFVAETEHQVVKHLDSHLSQISAKDEKTRAILEQMKDDEFSHATHAEQAGAAELPGVIKKLMSLSSKIMTKTSFWI